MSPGGDSVRREDGGCDVCLASNEPTRAVNYMNMI
jgi:hypothetical protein